MRKSIEIAVGFLCWLIVSSLADSVYGDDPLTARRERARSISNAVLERISEVDDKLKPMIEEHLAGYCSQLDLHQTQPAAPLRVNDVNAMSISELHSLLRDAKSLKDDALVTTIENRLQERYRGFDWHPVTTLRLRLSIASADEIDDLLKKAPEQALSDLAVVAASRAAALHEWELFDRVFPRIVEDTQDDSPGMQVVERCLDHSDWESAEAVAQKLKSPLLYSRVCEWLLDNEMISEAVNSFNRSRQFDAGAPGKDSEMREVALRLWAMEKIPISEFGGESPVTLSESVWPFWLNGLRHEQVEGFLARGSVFVERRDRFRAEAARWFVDNWQPEYADEFVADITSAPLRAAINIEIGRLRQEGGEACQARVNLERAFDDFVACSAAEQRKIVWPLYDAMRKSRAEMQALLRVVALMDVGLAAEHSVEHDSPGILLNRYKVLNDSTKSCNWEAVPKEALGDVAIECASRDYAPGELMEGLSDGEVKETWHWVFYVAVNAPSAYLDSWIANESDPNISTALLCAKLNRLTHINSGLLYGLLLELEETADGP